MRTFDIRYENGRFFHKSLTQASRTSSKSKNQKWKISVFDVFSNLSQELSKKNFYQLAAFL